MRSPAIAHRRNISVFAIGVDKASVSALRETIHTMPGFEFKKEFPFYAGESPDLPLLENLQQLQPDVCIIDLDRDRQRAMLTAEQIVEQLRNTAVFATSVDSRADFIIDAMRSGFSEYLLKPLARDRVFEALTKLEQKRRERVGAAGHRGKVYSFVGAKGGTGVTTLATHLGTYCAQLGARTLLIDQHADIGDVSIYLMLPDHKYHFYELVGNTHRLDEELLQGFAVRHSSGLEVLSSPEAFGAKLPSSPAALSTTLDFLRGIYDVVLIDCAPGLHAYNVTSIDASNALYLVTTPELPSIRNVTRYLDHLQRFNCSPDKIRVVINRYSRKAAITQEQVEKAIRRNVAQVVPNSYPDIIEAIHTGSPLPLDSRSELSHTFKQWASTLMDKGAEVEVRKPEPKRRIGILGL